MQTSNLSPSQKAALIKQLLNKQRQTTNQKPNKTIINFETRDLVNIPIFSSIKKLCAATLAYIPIEDPILEDKVLGICNNLPLISTIYELNHGSIALILLPIKFDDLYKNPEKLTHHVKNGLQLVNYLNINTCSLAGLLPSATHYGKSIETISKEQNITLTTGHATTAASVALSIEKAIKTLNLSSNELTICILGVGSIGQSVSLLLSKIKTIAPKKLILCDVESCNQLLKNLKRELADQCQFDINISLTNGKELNKDVYNCDIIVGCTNKANILDVEKLKPNCIVLDDSIPHCFDVKKAINKMKVSQNIFSEAGMLKHSSVINEYRYAPKELLEIKDHLPGLIWKRNSYEITSCILSAYLSTIFNATPTIGISDQDVSLEHLTILKENSFCAADYRIEGNLISEIKQN